MYDFSCTSRYLLILHRILNESKKPYLPGKKHGTFPSQTSEATQELQTEEYQTLFRLVHCLRTIVDALLKIWVLLIQIYTDTQNVAGVLPFLELYNTLLQQLSPHLGPRIKNVHSLFLVFIVIIKFIETWHYLCQKKKRTYLNIKKIEPYQACFLFFQV